MTALDFIAVDDVADPRIEPFRDVRDRDLVGRRGQFIAEGEVVLRHLAETPLHTPLAFLCAADRTARMADILAGLTAPAPVYVASQAVMDAIVGFPIHRGLLGLGARGEPSVDALLERRPSTVLALHGISNHDNMGGLFRNAAAFGVDTVVLDATSCDPLYRKALRVSVGAALRTPFARLAPDADLLAVLEGAGLTTVALSPSGRTALSDWRPPERVAMIFGAEGPGLPSELMARCQTLSIPMAEGFDSLNVATTSGIVLHQRAAARAD